MRCLCHCVGGGVQAKRHGADPAEQAQDAKVRNMKLHEWGTEQRIKMLEESINDRIVARVDSLEQSVEDTLDSNLVSRIGELEQASLRQLIPLGRELLQRRPLQHRREHRSVRVVEAQTIDLDGCEARRCARDALEQH